MKTRKRTRTHTHRKPSMIIHSVPQDITAENLEETILAQNPELGLISGDIKA